MSNADLIALAVAGLIFVSGAVLYYQMRAGKRRKAKDNRLESLTKVDETENNDDLSDLFRVLDGDRPQGFFAGIRHQINEMLRPAGGESQLRTVVLLIAVCGYGGYTALHDWAGLPAEAGLIVGVSLAIAVPFFYVRGMARKRREKFLEQFPDAIDLVVRAIRAGIPTSESISVVGRELQEPLAGEFRQIGQEISIGVPPNEALSEAAVRVGISDFNFFAVTLILQRETGGNLAETLENLSSLLRKRREMRLKVKALTGEARFTSKVIGSLPVVVVGALHILNPEYVQILFLDSTGQMFLGIATGLVIIGSIVLNRLVSMEI